MLLINNRQILKNWTLSFYTDQTSKNHHYNNIVDISIIDKIKNVKSENIMLLIGTGIVPPILTCEFLPEGYLIKKISLGTCALV